MGDWTTELDATQFIFSVRFDQGHRYLDKGGKAIIRLEDTLKGWWLPGQIDPNGANIYHFALGMVATFNAQWSSTPPIGQSRADCPSMEGFAEHGCARHNA